MTETDSPALPSTIFVISDSTGGTAEAMTRAALAQFEDYLVNVSTYTHITDPRRVEALARLAAKQNALIVFTLVNPEIREAIYEATGKYRVECVDLMGQLIGGISKQLGGMQPRGIPGRKTMLSDEYFRRVDAVEFTVKHDDGAEPRYLHKSDIVLVGVSRTYYQWRVEGVRGAGYQFLVQGAWAIYSVACLAVPLKYVLRRTDG